MTAAIISKGHTAKGHWPRAMATGLERHGISVNIYRPAKTLKKSNEALQRIAAGIVVTWGWRIAERFRALGTKVLVMETAPVGDLDCWLGLGWNGLNGRAQFPAIDDGGARWEQHFGHLLQPWRDGGEYILLIGQVRTDAALMGADIEAWYREAAEKLRWRFRRLPVVFRPHPLDPAMEVEGVETLEGDLDSALAGAALAVTYNSRVGVEAALAGVPVIACDHGSMAWPVAAQGLDKPIIRPDRSEWCSRLAWCQWSKDEVVSGQAWDCVRQVQ